MASSVDGLVSGMDTTTVINQLLSLERQPQLRLEAKKKAHETKVAAYQSVNTKLLALQTAADTLAKADTWKAFKVTSSSTSVSASASTSALPGSYTFEVRALAKASSAFYGDEVSSTALRVTNDATISITKRGETSAAIDVGDGSMASVVTAINAADAGVKAAAVQVSPGMYRLQLTSTTTGADSGLTVNGDLGVASPLVVGADAEIRVGEAGATTTPVDITSSTNTFTDVLPGVTLTVSKLETVSLDVTSDASGIAGQVQAMVTAANGVLDEIARQTAYDAETKKSSALTGDSTVRSLKQRLLNLVSSTLNGQSLSDVGIELTRDGKLEFAAATFTEAFADDPTGTAALFRPTGTFSNATPVSLVSAGDQTQPGPYGVTVTQEAAQAAITIDPPGVMVDGDAIVLRVPGRDAVTVSLLATDTSATIAAKLNDASAADGLGLVATAELDGSITVQSVAFGTSAAFAIDDAAAGLTVAVADRASLAGAIEGTETITVTTSAGSFVVNAAAADTVETLKNRINADAVTNGVAVTATVEWGQIVLVPPAGQTVSLAIAGGVEGTLGAYVPGIDVAGSFDDAGTVVEATGIGQVLTADTDSTRLSGFAVQVGEGAGTGLLGTFTYAPGLAQRLDSFAGDAVRAGTGLLTTIIEGNQNQIEDLGDQIEGWDTRIALKETTVRRQFSNLEVMLGKLRDQSNWLAGQLAGLIGSSGS